MEYLIAQDVNIDQKDAVRISLLSEKVHHAWRDWSRWDWLHCTLRRSMESMFRWSYFWEKAPIPTSRTKCDFDELGFGMEEWCSRRDQHRYIWLQGRGINMWSERFWIMVRTRESKILWAGIYSYEGRNVFVCAGWRHSKGQGWTLGSIFDSSDVKMTHSCQHWGKPEWCLDTSSFTTH